MSVSKQQILDRAARYVARMPVSLSGQGGHTAAFNVARTLRHGFGLTFNEALGIMLSWNHGCQPPWNMRDIEHKLNEGAKAAGDKPRGHLVGDGERRYRDGSSEGEESSKHQDPNTKIQGDQRNWRPFDREKLQSVQKEGLEVSYDWLAERSLSDVRHVTPGGFFRAILGADERVLIFTSEFTQGQFMFWNAEAAHRRGWYELGKKQTERGRFAGGPDDVPEGLRRARCGAWWMNQPVSGGWCMTRGTDKEGNAIMKWSRRTGECCTDWRHMVIESDEPGIEPLWLNFLVQLPLAIVALYTSGGRSVHALVRIGAKSLLEWGVWRDNLKPVLTTLGADKGVFSGVRLTRLPGVLRAGRMKEGQYERFREPQLQRLLYLNARADGTAICEQRRRRVAAAESSKHQDPSSKEGAEAA